MSTDPMLRHIDRVLREQQMFELAREMHTNMLRVEALIESAAPSHLCLELACEWCRQYLIPVDVIQDGIKKRHREYYSPGMWYNSLRDVLPFRTEIKW